MSQVHLNEMNSTNPFEHWNQDPIYYRDRSTICVGSYSAPHPLRLWRCYGTKDAIYQSVLAVRQSHANKSSSKSPVCPFDEYSYHYVLKTCEDNYISESGISNSMSAACGETVGAMTITRPDDGTVDCQSFYPPAMLSIFRNDLLTSCRFIILPAAQSSYALLRWMTTSVWKDQVKLGCRGGIINSQRDMTPFYRRMGFKLLEGFSFTHPTLGTDSQVLTLRADPSEQPYFRDAFQQLKSIIPAELWNRVLEFSCNAQQEKTASEKPTNHGGKVYSFAAGSSSMDPHGYRIIDGNDNSRIREVCSLFPQIADYFNPRTMVLAAYPATLGLTSPGVLVDSYLHPPTFVRSVHLAAIEERPLVIIAQPLLGADLLLRTLQQQVPLPRRILWASGGYYLPESLEQFIRTRLKQAKCDLELLHCYGTAEIGHSIFVATDRLASGRPHYRKATAHLQTELDERNGSMRALTPTGWKEFEDEVWSEGNGYDIVPTPSRLSKKALQTLESWNLTDWERYTGYIAQSEETTFAQCRQWIQPTPDHPSSAIVEIAYYDFFARYGGSVQTKPNWGAQLTIAGLRKPSAFLSDEPSSRSPQVNS